MESALKYPKVTKFAVEVACKSLNGYKNNMYLNRSGCVGFDVHLFDTEEIARSEMDKYLIRYPHDVQILKVNVESEVIHIRPAYTAL